MNKEALQKHLFTGRTHVLAILDGASIEGLRMRLYESNPPNFCLFRGELEPDIAETAPYLVALQNGSPFCEWLLTENFGKNWGVFIHTRQSITEMRKHFRALVTVHDEAGTPLIFRFYDPRVVHKFLPTCNTGELKTFFGKVDAFFAEMPDGKGFSRFALENNMLKETKLS